MARILPADEAGLHEAERVLRDGGVIGFPGDTWYGLAGDPWNADAVAEIFRLKHRGPDAPLSILAANLGAASDVMAPSADEWSTRARTLDGPAAALAAKYWPGRLTLVVSAHPKLPLALTAGTGVVGVRVPANPIAARLARAVGVISATSANAHGMPPARTAGEVATQFPDLALVLDGGPVAEGAPSSVVDVSVSPPRIVRAGAIPRDALEKTIQGIRDRATRP